MSELILLTVYLLFGHSSEIWDFQFSDHNSASKFSSTQLDEQLSSIMKSRVSGPIIAVLLTDSAVDPVFNKQQKIVSQIDAENCMMLVVVASRYDLKSTGYLVEHDDLNQLFLIAGDNRFAILGSKGQVLLKSENPISAFAIVKVINKSTGRKNCAVRQSHDR